MQVRSDEAPMVYDEPPLQWSEMPECGHCNATALRQAMRRVSLIYDSYIAQCGLKTTQRSILGYISRAGTPTMGSDMEAYVVANHEFRKVGHMRHDTVACPEPAPTKGVRNFSRLDSKASVAPRVISSHERHGVWLLAGPPVQNFKWRHNPHVLTFAPLGRALVDEERRGFGDLGSAYPMPFWQRPFVTGECTPFHVLKAGFLRLTS